MKGFVILAAIAATSLLAACDDSSNSDDVQRRQQESLLQEGTSQVGMPAIKNFRERKLLKDILELRDQNGLITYTYTFSEMTGQYKFFCNSVGYGIPYATQFTNPQKQVNQDWRDSPVIPQADPNGLFSPQSAEGTWVMCKDPNGDKTAPVYVEPRVIVSPFKMNAAQLSAADQ